MIAQLALTAALTLTQLPTTPTSAHTTTTRTCSNPLFDVAAAYAGWPIKEIPKVGRTAYKESRCKTNARSRTRDSGLMQINDVHLRWLHLTSAELMEPNTNLRAALKVWKLQGWKAWTGGGG